MRSLRSTLALCVFAPVVMAEPIRIALTFDDGFSHHFTLIAPLLEEYGYRGAFSVVTENIGRLDGRLAWRDLREMKRRGHDIFSHGCTHLNLARLCGEGRGRDVAREIVESAAIIKHELGESPKVFCFPFNAGDGVCVMVREAGMIPMQTNRFNFGAGTFPGGDADLGAHLTRLKASGAAADALMIHGVGHDSGAWRPFEDIGHFRRFLEEIKDREKAGEIKVVPYLEIAESVAPDARSPVKVIFDTDMYTDFDDAGALACLHALADAGECEILATVANTRDCMSVAMCEIINAYYGRADIPVGCSKAIGKAGVEPAHLKFYAPTVEKYAKWVRHRNSNDAPDANSVYRRVLASQPDGSVVVCSVGFMTNMRRLLETKPDSISSLDGRALVAKKVRHWVAMACRYPEGKEYNAMTDAESSRLAFDNWPTQIIFTDFEYGRDCFSGRALVESNRKGCPVSDVYAGRLPSRDEIRLEPAKFLRWCESIAGHASWDQTAVLIAVRGTGGYFNVSRGTYRMVGSDGANEWVPDAENGRHLRVTEKTSKVEVGRIIDELMLRFPAALNRQFKEDGGKKVSNR